MTFEIIEKLYQSGDLKTLIHSGVVSPNVLIYRKVFNLYNERIESGRKKMEALEDVSFTFGYKDRQIYNILKFMRQELNEGSK